MKERTRTLLVHAAADPSLWKEALETATLLYNVGPTSGRPLTPTEMFFGFKPDVSVLRTWGCVVHVHVPAAQRTVFCPKTQVGMVTGYSPNSKAYRVYMGAGVWKESRDVTFIENEQGATRVGIARNFPACGTDNTGANPFPGAEVPIAGSRTQVPAFLPFFWDIQDASGSAEDREVPLNLGPSGSQDQHIRGDEDTPLRNQQGAHSSRENPHQSWSVLDHMQNVSQRKRGN